MRYLGVLCLTFLCLTIAGGLSSLRAQAPAAGLDPAITRMVGEVSQERIKASIAKLEGYGTRNTHSDGILQARDWLVAELQSYSPRLQVSVDTHAIKKGGRFVRDLDLHNVVAVLPGKVHPNRHVILSAHYDTVNYIAKPAAVGEERQMDAAASAEAEQAPGANDDGSGVAAVLELARVMSAQEFDKSVVFILFAGEEQGLVGARHYADAAKAKGMLIEAVLNNDIIGGDTAGNGRTAGNVVRLFSAGPEDSPARTVARYAKDVAERYVPSMKFDLIFRNDRFSRGGDHTPFQLAGYGAVRISSATENYSQQHTALDTLANMSVPYTARVAQMNLAVAASLAAAPAPPVVTRTTKTGTEAPLLTRGKSGYDAALQWKYGADDPDVIGFSVLLRSTTAPLWEREVFVGNVTETVLPDVSIDDVVIGVRAIDKQGHASLVSAYHLPPRTFDTAGESKPAAAKPAVTEKKD